MNDGSFRSRGRATGSGVTLIELLVVLAIMGVILSVVAGVIAGGIVVWDSARSFDSQRMSAMWWCETLESELRSSFPFHGTGFVCESQRLRFPGVIRDPAAGRVGHVCEIEYLLSPDGRRMYRFEREFPPGSRNETGGQVVLSDVERVTFSCERDPAAGEDPAVVPLSVKVRVDLGSSGRRFSFERVIHVPVRKEYPEDEEEDDTGV